MNCLYCKNTIHIELIINNTKIQVCPSKKCFNLFAFDYPIDLNIYTSDVKKMLLNLAKSSSTTPHEKYTEACLVENSQIGIQFMNFLQVNMGGVGITSDEFELSNNTGTKKFSIYTFEYQDQHFESRPFTYLFHGSPLHNWFSIVNNGLKNFSGTDKMAHGAAYGKGIYFSDDLSLSAMYSNSYKGEYMVGVFQVTPDKQTEQKNIRDYYRKTNRIYVVPDENRVKLKYLVQMSNSDDLYNFGNSMIEYFDKRLLYHMNSVKKLNEIVLKRMNKEKEAIISILPEIEIKVIEPHIWDCIFNNIQFRILFPFNYPLSPPDVITTAGVYGQDIIDGHICFYELYRWTITRKLSGIVIKTIDTIMKYNIQGDINKNTGEPVPWKEAQSVLCTLNNVKIIND